MEHTSIPLAVFCAVQTCAYRKSMAENAILWRAIREDISTVLAERLGNGREKKKVVFQKMISIKLQLIVRGKKY